MSIMHSFAPTPYCIIMRGRYTRIYMNTNRGVIGAAVAAAIVIGVIAYLQGFDAQKIACEDIAAARAQLQAQYDAGVDASVQIFADERSTAEQRLSQCVSAAPVDPCATQQSARDAAYQAYFAIQSPADDAPYAEFQSYYMKRDEAYNAYKSAKAALDQCRAANPPKEDVPYEKSDTKACFDAYDASMAATQSTFDKNTQTMRSALKSALGALDAREKACNPPTGKEQFTVAPQSTVGEGGAVINIQMCRPLDSDADAELLALRRQASDLETEIQSSQTTIENAQKRVRKLQSDLAAADTYIPPESTKTQFEGALNALRGERKESIRVAIDSYQNLITRKQAEKARSEQALKDVQTKIAARLRAIQEENAARQRNYPTALHQAGPDKCAYYHCHGTLCGMHDPDSEACGHGSTTQEDTDCSAFIKAYFEAAGVK